VFWRSGPLLVLAMLVAGLALGGIEARRPGWSEPIPTLGVLLGVMLALDLAVQTVAARGRLDPLTMPFRAAAFILGGIAATVVPALMR
jgi:hypothetical protein